LAWKTERLCGSSRARSRAAQDLLQRTGSFRPRILPVEPPAREAEQPRRHEDDHHDEDDPDRDEAGELIAEDARKVFAQMTPSRRLVARGRRHIHKRLPSRTATGEVALLE
jgi:hypothetical protein